MHSLQGHFLIASSKLLDPNFARSVVLIVQHNDEGALGLVLNRPLEATIEDTWEQVSDAPCQSTGPLHQGGPCGGTLMAIHTRPDLSQMEIFDGLYVSTDKDSIEQLVAQGEEPIKFFVGYSGWTAGQLEGELEAGGWLTAKALEDQILGEPDGLWETLHESLTLTSMYPVPPRLIPADPTLN